MVLRALALALLSLTLLFSGCGGDDATKSQPTSAKQAKPAAGDLADARNVLSPFLAFGADTATLTAKLRPQTFHYRRIFNSEAAGRVDASLGPHWDANRIRIAPQPGQTELVLWRATGLELQQGTGDSQQFSPELRAMAEHLKRDAVFVKFRFAAPGQSEGMAYEGLVFARERWSFVPKPWMALQAQQ